MANVNIEGMDELIRSLEKANLFDDETTEEMLNAGADIITESISKEMMKSNFTYNNIKEKKRIKEKIDTKSFERKIQIFRQYSSSHNENSFRTSSHSSSSKKKEIIKVDSKFNGY